jgi:hypothetical protein
MGEIKIKKNVKSMKTRECLNQNGNKLIFVLNIIIEPSAPNLLISCWTFDRAHCKPVVIKLFFSFFGLAGGNLQLCEMDRSSLKLKKNSKCYSVYYTYLQLNDTSELFICILNIGTNFRHTLTFQYSTGFSLSSF